MSVTSKGEMLIKKPIESVRQQLLPFLSYINEGNIDKHSLKLDGWGLE